VTNADIATTLAAPVLRVRAIGRRLGDVRAVWCKGRVDPRLREQVTLAVAHANDCRWCSYAHRRWALATGVSDAELAALEGLDPDGFDRRTWAAVAWAQARTAGRDRRVPGELAAELARHYDARERADLELVADVMTVANRAANALDDVLSLARAVPAPRDPRGVQRTPRGRAARYCS